MSPLEAMFSTIKGFLINEVQLLVKGKPKPCRMLYLNKLCPALAPNGTDAMYDYTVEVEIKSDNHQYCRMENNDLKAEMSGVIDKLVEKASFGYSTTRCMKVRGEYGSPLTVKFVRSDSIFPLTFDDAMCSEQQEPDLYLTIYSDIM